MAATEHTHQTALIKWCKHFHPSLLVFSVPNGVNCTPNERSKLNREGLVKGVPDLFVPSLKLFIEMKTVKGKLSKYQKEVIAELQFCGYEVLVAYSFLEAKEHLNNLINNHNN